QEVRSLITQLEHFTRKHRQVGRGRADRFLDQRAREARALREGLQRRDIDESNVEILRRYARIQRETDKSVLPTQLCDLLEGDENCLYYLYIGRDRGLLSWAVSEIEYLQERKATELAKLLEGRTRAEVQAERANLAFDDLMREVSAEKEALDEVEQTEEMHEGSAHDEGTLFEESLNAETESPTNRRILGTVRQILDFLETRRRLLGTWARIYSVSRPVCEGSLLAIMNKYTLLLQRRIDLIREQELKCKSLTETLNKDELEISVYTPGSGQAISEHRDFIERLATVKSNYIQLYNASPHTALRSLSHVAEAYDSLVTELGERLDQFNDVADTQSEFLFCPIEISLRQGNVYRDFHRLSFGQKCGIILKMVLASTNKKIVLIDQPEDNLDATSIVNMLAPTLNRLANDRQVIIATHNSHLVMGLNNPTIVVLGSLGEYGRIQDRSSPLNTRRVVREMLDVLEGGIESFNQKLTVYEEFVRKLSGSIDDMDIMMIESSFRRRTIDGLRNFLQPIVSDRSLLEYARHELKQPDSSRIHEHVIATIGQIQRTKLNPDVETATLIERIEKLLERLDNHISKL